MGQARKKRRPCRRPHPSSLPSSPSIWRPALGSSTSAPALAVIHHTSVASPSLLHPLRESRLHLAWDVFPPSPNSPYPISRGSGAARMIPSGRPSVDPKGWRTDSLQPRESPSCPRARPRPTNRRRAHASQTPVEPTRRAPPRTAAAPARRPPTAVALARRRSRPPYASPRLTPVAPARRSPPHDSHLATISC